MGAFGRFSTKKVTAALSLTHGAGVTTVTNAAQTLNGLLGLVTILAPAADDGAATLTINLIDADGVTVYTKAAVAANTKVKDLQTTAIPLSGQYQVQVVFSANQTVTDSVTTVNLLIQAP